MGDFNVEPDETNVKPFCNYYNPKYLNKKPTCFKNGDKPSCIHFFLTNNSHCFEDCLALETGQSDFHKLIVTVLKTNLKILKYRDYKNFDT